MKKNYLKIISELGEGRVNVDEVLSKYSTYRIGGPADLFFRAKTQNDLQTAISLCKKYQVSVFILGGGTNILFKDSGYRGMVLKNETSNIRLVGMRGIRKKSKKKVLTEVREVFLESESGVGVNRLVRFCLDQGLGGIESFLGQPGTVGGAIWINAHNILKGRFFGDLINSAKILTDKGQVEMVDKKYFKFGYDESAIQKTKDVVLSVVISLKKDKKQKLWEEAQKALEYRKKTQPQGVFSAGCVFRNIKKSEALRLATPGYTCSAGYLIDQVGLKGKTVGGAMISESHANFLINRGEASSDDVIKLIKLAKEKVQKKFNIDLKEEIVIV